MVSPVLAYIGPGAGFAFLGSFFSLIASAFFTASSLLVWPFRTARAWTRRRRGFRKASIRRLIFLGLDGLDPRLAERFMAEGKMPNLSRLREQGSFHRLRTTFPPQSPVAWSTFATGVNPAKHNIFDFLNRSLKSYRPELSSAKVRPAGRSLRLGRWRVPLARPVIEMRRRSRPFWKILGEHSIPSTILRVPVSFPPDKFNGWMLSAMSTPDLRGTQGSFTQFTTRLDRPDCEAGSRLPLRRSGDWLEGMLYGPRNEFLESGLLALSFKILASPGSDSVTLEIGGEPHRLKPGEYSPWIRLAFRAAPGVRIRGVVRFLVTEIEPEFSLYVTPIQIDPEAPALPISHPPYYATYLAKSVGSFATAGMAEDTWALNENIIDEKAFLDQAYLILAEREAMLENALAHTRRGVVACVVDTSDRVQHMFLGRPDGRGVIEALYRRMDAVVGKVMDQLAGDAVLFVLSDHGFCAFESAVNLNSWLCRNGYLTLAHDALDSGRYFEGVDWSRTRAYALGLNGLYLNLQGREGQGTVPLGAEAEALKRELAGRLTGLRDEERNRVAIRRVYARDQLYRGPYLDAAPDLVIGYNEGYRASWDAAVGKVSAHVIEDNPKAWSADHCVDPELVPGVLFCSRKIDAEDPGIEDMAPTALALFGVERPSWMDGKPVLLPS